MQKCAETCKKRSGSFTKTSLSLVVSPRDGFSLGASEDAAGIRGKRRILGSGASVSAKRPESMGFLGLGWSRLWGTVFNSAFMVSKKQA